MFGILGIPSLGIPKGLLRVPLHPWLGPWPGQVTGVPGPLLTMFGSRLPCLGIPRDAWGSPLIPQFGLLWCWVLGILG
jgi:hypothetical protein